MLSEFLTTSFQNVRSSHRTDTLHTVLIEEVKKRYPEFASLRWVQEFKLKQDGFGGTFDVDIIGFDKDDNIAVAVLAKAINSNVNKNVKNYANTTIGEASRLMFAPNVSPAKVLFVSVLPRLAPRFNKEGKVTGLDNVVSAKQRTNVDKVLQAQYNGVVEVLDFYYDIDNITTLTHKEQFDVIGVSNLIA